MRAPRRARRATSRALLNPRPDWLALSVACSELSSENPWNSLSSDLRPTSSKILASLFLKDCVTVHSDNVVDSDDAKALTKKGKFCLLVLTKLLAIKHGTDDVCFRQELVCNFLARP